MANRPDVITIRVEPIGSSNRNVGFEALIAELQAVHGTLVRADKIESEGRQTTRYDVVSLSMNSPAQVQLAPRPIDRRVDRRGAVVGSWARGLASIRSGSAPDSFDRPMLEKVRELASGVRKQRVRTTISYGDSSVQVDHVFERRILEILQRTETMFGSFEGRLESLNLHNSQNVCAVYPRVGARKIVCHFRDELRHRVLKSMDRYVLATGMAEYQYKDAFPHRLELHEIEVMDQANDQANLYDIRGIEPNATGDESSEDFIRQIRDGWH